MAALEEYKRLGRNRESKLVSGLDVIVMKRVMNEVR